MLSSGTIPYFSWSQTEPFVTFSSVEGEGEGREGGRGREGEGGREREGERGREKRGGGGGVMKLIFLLRRTYSAVAQPILRLSLLSLVGQGRLRNSIYPLDLLLHLQPHTHTHTHTWCEKHENNRENGVKNMKNAERMNNTQNGVKTMKNTENETV